MKTITARSRKADIESNRPRKADIESKLIDKEIQLISELDGLLARALEGDRRAVGAIAVGLGPLLLQEAEVVLGRDFAHEAGDVLQDFFVSLLEGEVSMRPVQGRAIQWMCGVVRAISRKHRGERSWDWDIDDDNPSRSQEIQLAEQGGGLPATSGGLRAIPCHARVRPGEQVTHRIARGWSRQAPTARERRHRPSRRGGSDAITIVAAPSHDRLSETVVYAASGGRLRLRWQPRRRAP